MRTVIASKTKSVSKKKSAGLNKVAKEFFLKTVHKDGKKGVILQKKDKWVIIAQSTGIYATTELAYVIATGTTDNPHIDIEERSFMSMEKAYDEMINYMIYRKFEIRGNSESTSHLLTLLKKIPVKAVARNIDRVEIATTNIKNSMKGYVEIKFKGVDGGKQLRDYLKTRILPDGVHVHGNARLSVTIRLDPSNKSEALKMIYYIENELTNFCNSNRKYRWLMEITAFSC